MATASEPVAPAVEVAIAPAVKVEAKPLQWLMKPSMVFSQHSRILAADGHWNRLGPAAKSRLSLLEPSPSASANPVGCRSLNH